MKILDLFSGIGGFSLAGHWMGWSTLAFCERDAFCRQVLAKNFPGIPIYDDIHTLRGDEHGAVDLVCGGFPCQPFSDAGERRGQDDDRYLWPEMARVIATARPTWIVAENVTGIITMALDQALSDLEDLGYTARTLVVPAVALNARHRRDRVWIVAHANGVRLEAGLRQPGVRPEPRITQTYDHFDFAWVPPPGDTRSFRDHHGFSGWVDRTARWIKSLWRHRVKALGNAVAPPVVYQIFQAIDAADRMAAV